MPTGDRGKYAAATNNGLLGLNRVRCFRSWKVEQGKKIVSTFPSPMGMIATCPQELDG
jgi:hypothetical protein